MRTTLLFSLCLLTSGSIAGCIGDTTSTVEPASQLQVGVDDATEGEPWNLTLSGTVEMILAEGRPFGPRQGFTVVAGCGSYAFQMPNGTAEATFAVSGPAINDTRPGAGYQSFRIKHEDGPYQQAPRNDEPREERTIQVDDPDSGKWLVWVWPWGPNVNQVYDVKIQLTGTGGPPAEEPELYGVGFCEGEHTDSDMLARSSTGGPER